MYRDDVFRLRIESDVRDEVEERAKDAGITVSEWIRIAIEFYLEHEGDEIPYLEEVEDMDWDELTDVIDDLKLEIDPDDFDSGGFLSGTPDKDSEDTENLREAVIDELGLSDEDYDEDDDDED